MAGGYIQLGDIWSAQELVTGEGVENVLSAAQIIGWPGLVAISATNLKNIPEHAPKAKDIIIAADNDPAGRDNAKQAARRFNMRGCRVSIAWPPDDYNDWNEGLSAARSNADVAELRRTILDAPIFEERAEAQALSMTEVMAMEIPPREYLMEPWLETSSLNMVHGRRGEGKTFLMLAIAHAVATGTPFLGWVPQRQARVLYVDGELPGPLLQQRLKYLAPPTDNLRLLSRDILLRDGNVMLPDLATREGRDFLDKVIEQDDSEVIILDSLSTLFRAGVENDAESWQEPQDWLLGHRFQGRTIIFVHHEGKNNSPRGTSKREDTLDTCIRIRKQDDLKDSDTESVFEITFTKKRSFTESRPLIAHMSVSENGTIEWQHGFSTSTHDEVIELVGEGFSQSEIAKKVGLSNGRVSQIIKADREGKNDKGGLEFSRQKP
jgi:putative DNA primase/helicase